MATPGISAKLNIPKMQSPKAAASNAVLHANRANTFASPQASSGLGGGIRHGIAAQRTKVGMGQHNNARAFYNNTLRAERNSMNSRAFFSVDSFMPQMMPAHVHNNSMSTLEKVAMFTMLGATLAATTASIIDTLKSDESTSVKSKSLANSDIPGANTGIPQLDADKFIMSNSLRGSNSLGDVVRIENMANDKLGKLNEDYKLTGEHMIGEMNNKLQEQGVKNGLELAGLSSFNTNKLALSELNVDPQNLSTLDTALTTINKDIEKFEGFINTDIADATKKLGTKKQEISTGIQSCRGQIANLESQILTATENSVPSKSELETQLQQKKSELEKLKTQQQQIESAEKAINSVKTQAESIIKELHTKQNTIGDIKQVKSQIADKKYDAAKNDDLAIEKNKSKMDKLQKEIVALKEKAANGDTKAQARFESKVAEYNGLAKQMKTLYQSITSLDGNTTVTNSKGKQYTVINTSENSNYTQEISADRVKTRSQISSEDSQRMKESINNLSAKLSELINYSDGEKITIGSEEYTKQNGMFINADGQEISMTELAKKMTEIN